jgi:hypothetical protein
MRMPGCEVLRGYGKAVRSPFQLGEAGKQEPPTSDPFKASNDKPVQQRAGTVADITEEITDSERFCAEPCRKTIRTASFNTLRAEQPRALPGIIPLAIADDQAKTASPWTA